MKRDAEQQQDRVARMKPGQAIRGKRWQGVSLKTKDPPQRPGTGRVETQLRICLTNLKSPDGGLESRFAL